MDVNSYMYGYFTSRDRIPIKNDIYTRFSAVMFQSLLRFDSTRLTLAYNKNATEIHKNEKYKGKINFGEKYFVRRKMLILCGLFVIDVYYLRYFKIKK